MKNHFYSFLIFLFLFSSRLYALDGAIGSHDPTNIIKEGNRYWMFTTGNGIYAAYSDDMFSWHTAPKTVFPVGTWPEWINQAVPGFEGFFWAPEVIYMNGKYYMYYSCSTFGSPRSAIGVATSPTLDQNSPSYHWTDLGMVVSSAVQTDINAIDPAIIKDEDGRVYMSYGSFSGGIGVLELDPVTGLRKEGASIKHVAGGNRASWEAPYIFKEGGYYYLVVNRGFCCRGASSTYFLVMGRSTNINGPYLDKAGIDLRSGGGTRILGTSGRYIGPGHFGLMRENGVNYVSMHYYDGEDNGHPKLDIANLGFGADGWPYITRDWLPAGRYKVTNQNSGLIWDALGGTGAPGEALSQGEDKNELYQQWDFTPVGNGIYKIANAQSKMVADVFYCKPDNGTKLWLWYDLNNNCQRFKIERTADGAFIFTSLTGRRIIEVPAASTTSGTELAIWDHNGFLCQRWYINTASSPVAKATNPSPAHEATGVNTPNLTMTWNSEAGKFNLLTGTSLSNLHIKARDLTQPFYQLTDTLPIGTTYYWRVDTYINGVSSAGSVWSFTVADTLAPTILTKNIVIALDSTGQASITAAEIDNGSHDAYGIATLELDRTLFDCSNIGNNQVTLKGIDKNGNMATASALVTVIGARPNPAIAVNRADQTYTGTNPNTIVLGYGAQSLLLSASNDTSEPTKTKYSWSPATGLSNPNSANPTFSPTQAGSYTFTVKATNEFGCTADASVTIHVMDARCGKATDKVLVCHKGSNICIEAISVKEHLAHGCKLASCTTTILASNESAYPTGNLDKTSLTTYPNPLSDKTTAKLSIAEAGAYSLELYNMQGVLVKVITSGYSEGNKILDYELDASNLRQGAYLLLLKTEKSLLTNHIIVQK